MNDYRLLLRSRVHGLVVALLFLETLSAADIRAESLHCRIDRLIESSRVGPPAALTSDAEFLRRVSLDLTGMPPSVEELRTFLADQLADKRARKIDRLLASPLFARHWATTLDVMLMERRPSVNVSTDLWHGYLLSAAQTNRPLNQVMTELLSANGTDPKLRAPARFFLDRGSEPNLITRDVGRIFFGRDMQCAQCHNHPLVKDYQQSDYYGLLAFISPGYPQTRKEGNKETTYHAEKAGSDLAFDSVFVKNDKHVTGPRIVGGAELDEPVFPPGEEYQVKPADGVVSVPKFSRRAKLASLTTDGANRAFNLNIANRLWGVMMGRGLVHPVDLHHPHNPPSQPELLNLLADEIVARRFNARDFLRELALTRAYQQAIDMPEEASETPAELTAKLDEQKARIEPLEAAAESARKAYSSAVKVWHQIEEALVPLVAEQDKMTVKHAEANTKNEAAHKALVDGDSQIAVSRDTAKALSEAAARAQDVVKKLPKDKEIVDAAATFTKRHAIATAQITSLEKAAVEKRSALKKATEEAVAAAKAVEAARAKVRPARESVRQKEQTVLAAREKMAEARSVAEEQQKRLKLLEAFAHYKALQEQAISSDRALISRRDGLVAAKKRSAELQAILQQREIEAKAADLARSKAEKTHSDARSALALYQKIVTRVDAALAATEAARQLLPDDRALSEAAQKIKDKSAELPKTAPALESRIDAAVGPLAKATELHNAAKAALSACLHEKARREAAVADALAALGAEESRSKAARSKLGDAANELAVLRGNHFAQAQLKPLTPEQICWSVLKVTGVYDRYLRVEEAELDKKKPLVGPLAYDPFQKITRGIELERRTYEKLKGNVPPFIAIYAAAPGQPQNDFFATADQALFAANGGSINGWIAPAGGNVSERMIQEKDPNKAALDLYMTILSRPPAPEESADVTRLLAAPGKDKKSAVQELVWGLLTSVEFRFNH
jgi:Protein of unknown function (DUF1549)/Protein of unknown function (DUF1553)